MPHEIPSRPDSRFAVFTLFMVFPSLFSCGGDSGTTEPEPPVATTVVITPGSPTLTAIGATAQLTAEVRDQNGQVMGGAGVTWNSETPTVASVTQAGVVTALSEGSATITATAGSARGSATVTVSQAISSITVTPATATIETGETVQLSAQARDANNNAVNGVTFTWSTQSSTIANVDNSGLVTGNQAGSTTVTATSAGVDGAAEITVVLPPVASVEVSGAGYRQLVDRAAELGALPFPRTKDAPIRLPDPAGSNQKYTLFTLSSSGQVYSGWFATQLKNNGHPTSIAWDMFREVAGLFDNVEVNDNEGLTRLLTASEVSHRIDAFMSAVGRAVSRLKREIEHSQVEAW